MEEIIRFLLKGKMNLRLKILWAFAIYVMLVVAWFLPQFLAAYLMTLSGE